MGCLGRHVRRANVNIHSGVLQGIIEFKPGLNLICGENGTCKTNVLRAIKNGNFEASESGVRILAISPKRNAERRTIENALEQIRAHNRTLTTFIQERGGAQINDNTFDNYQSVPEIYLLVYQEACRDGGDRIERMAKTTEDFNKVIQMVFPHYQLVSAWDQKAGPSGAPRISLMKHGGKPVPIEGLSLGEQEVLSLILNLHAAKDSYDVFLIDEPEIHLNWHLEERLFRFLLYLANHGEKQLIVVTHSRAVFTDELLPLVQFFYWNGDKVAWGREISEEQRKRIAGEAIEIIRIGQQSKRTIFVEDRAHKAVVQALASVLGKDVVVNAVGRKENVRSIYRLSKVDGDWRNSYFMEDGDNEGNPHPGDHTFVHLEMYCIENYLLDVPVLAKLSGKSEADIQQALVGFLKGNKKVMRHKFVAFAANSMPAANISMSALSEIDASELIEPLLGLFGIGLEDFAKRYTEECVKQGRLEAIFPRELLACINGS